jgi:hypothetical protein
MGGEAHVALAAEPAVQQLQIPPATSARHLLSLFLLRGAELNVELDGSQHDLCRIANALTAPVAGTYQADES